MRKWFYLDFAAAGKGHMGSIYVQGREPADAIRHARAIGIAVPDAECLFIPLTSKIMRTVPRSYRNRLLSKAELQELTPDEPLKNLKELEAQGYNMDTVPHDFICKDCVSGKCKTH